MTKNDFEVDTWNSQPSKGSAGKTGLWRTFRPIINHDDCSRCEMCILYCPEPCITLDPNDKSHKKGKVNIDYDYCKGCGICAYECPQNCIEMVKETELIEDDK